MHLHIERLVVDGLNLGAGAERQIESALRESLAPMLMANPAVAQGMPAHAHSMEGAPVELSAQPDAGSVGSAAAHGLFGGLRA